MSMSPLLPSAPASLPMPVAAWRSTSLPTRFSFPEPSAAVTSLIAPAVAVTLMALLVVVMWPSLTWVAASNVTFPVPAE